MTYPDRESPRDVTSGLAPLFPIAGFQGSVGDYIEALWWQYRAMVHDPGIVIGGRRLVACGEWTADGRHTTFWHLITDTFGSGRRLSPCRCAHLPRAWHLLELFGQADPRVVWWRERRRKRSHLHVAPLDLSMVVVLRENSSTLVLLTAYPTSSDQQFTRAAAAWESGRCERAPVARHLAWRHPRSMEPTGCREGGAA